MIMNNKCMNKTISIEKYEEIYKKLENNITNWKENKENIVIFTKNVTLQMSSYNEQKFNNNIYLSNIDIGKCEEYLKEKYTIDDDLIIIKSDIKNEDLTKTYVQYEIFNPNNLKKIALDECIDIPVIINVPVNISNDIEILYNSLNNSGYNLFNPNDSFYNDICTPYTTLNNTDIINEDRKELFSKFGNISLCQKDCEFISYSSETKKSLCQCEPKTENFDLNTTIKLEMFSSHVLYDKLH